MLTPCATNLTADLHSPVRELPNALQGFGSDLPSQRWSRTLGHVPPGASGHSHSLSPAMLSELVVEFCCKQTEYQTEYPMQICHRYKLGLSPPLHSGPQSWWEASGHRFLIFEITAPGNTSSVFQAHFIKQTVTADCQKDYQVSARMTKNVSELALSQGLSKLC